MALSANSEQELGGRSYELDTAYFVMAPSVAIYKRAALTIDSGIVRSLTTGAGKRFIGFAMDAKTTTASMTHEQINVLLRGQLSFAFAGASLSNICGEVYATDDNTFTMDSAGDAVKIGCQMGGAIFQF